MVHWNPPKMQFSHSSILKYQESTSANVPGISSYEQQVALENIPLDRWRLATVQKTLCVLSDGAQIMQPNSLTEWHLLDTPHGNMETMIPINIREQLTRSTLYWNNGLKPKAPDDCARNAQFKMITVSDYQDGLIVKFQPLVKTAIPDSLLCVNCSPEHASPMFVLLPDGYQEEYTVNQFRWGPGDADLRYFEFVNPYSQQLCYWVVEEDDIVVRTQEEVSNKKLDVHVFFTQEVADCD